MLNDYEALKKEIVRHHDAGKPLAAICAAPLVFGGLGLLEGKRATCYPGFEEYLKGATVVNVPTVTDSSIITGQGTGTGFRFRVGYTGASRRARVGGTSRQRFIIEIKKPLYAAFLCMTGESTILSLPRSLR